jgi:acetylornithine/succinyldiaminopimelate/putrescine aminotransferase
MHPSAIESESSHLLQVYAQLPLELVSATGVFLRTEDGSKILDLYGGHAVAALGYAHPRVLETLQRQAETMTFQTNAVALEVRARAAARLARFAPQGLGRIFFVNSGAEANENALRLAFFAAGGAKRDPAREKVVAVEQAFHGRTAAAAAVSWGSAKWYGFPRTPFPVTFVRQNDAEQLENAIDDTTAAVILEPIQGMAGAVELESEFLEAARRRADETGAILIFDEVQSGVGRSGYGFAADKHGVVPDILTTAKALAAGFPVGAVLTGDRIARHATKGSLGTTFGGGPMACALVETVIDVIETEGLLENVRNVSDRIRETCVVGPVESIQGAGFLLGLRCNRPATDVRDSLLKQNILVGTSADPDVVRLLPPLILEEEHVGILSRALEGI